MSSDAFVAAPHGPPALPPDARIDAHVSLWRQAPPAARLHPCFPGDARSFLPEHLEPILRRSRFEAALLVSSGATEDERDCLSAWMEEFPFLWGMVAGWSEDVPDSPALSALRRAHRLRGVWTVMPELGFRGKPAWRAALDWCRQAGLTLELTPPAGPCDFAALLSTATECQVPLVLAHLGGVPTDSAQLASWMHAMRALATQPQVFVKLSGLHSTPARTWPVSQLASLFVFLLETFGPRRLLFGTGWPYCLPARSWKECLARFTQAMGALGQDDRMHLLGSTAQRAYAIHNAG